MPKVDVKKIIQELIVPELQDIKSSISELRTEIKRLDEKVDIEMKRIETKLTSSNNEIRSEIGVLRAELESFKNETNTKFDSLRKELESFKNEFRTEIKRLDEKIDIAIQIRERLAALETKVASLIK
ncbi:hypothetical protein [Candidatus Chrysopegis kryptomonas]|uniref:Uncharacterized protein n=1 Tax=Candidatus Chryseopegocella kryptomonas TaxID=1633643 RepID=A0A0N7MWE8_9BACT|nr:hypothetical protein [Candidatus Chrysopegis kryptomonas]CUS98443.1 hypothetical protein JGI23_00483 [Candidatus Chrysopegis kryptomonas]